MRIVVTAASGRVPMLVLGLLLAASTAVGREGLVMNVYTVPSWRGRGVARQLMETIIAFAADAGIVRLVLHASPAGRPLYEKLGFTATREMIYTGPLAADGPWTGRDRLAAPPCVTARPSA